MKKYSEEQIHKAFEIGKEVYKNDITVSEGADILVGTGMPKSSSLDYIYAYAKLREGKLYTRTINSYATEYYLERILAEDGTNGLKNALLALSQHINYYEDISGATVKTGRKIYEKYLELVKDGFAEAIFPDEVENDTKYSEGKTRQVVVNNYERNTLARQKCIDHYGLNCQVCDFNFQIVYGDLGRDFIHVHHIVDIATIGKEYSVDPIKDLVPVCPNCHAMLHKNKPAFTITELKSIINKGF